MERLVADLEERLRKDVDEGRIRNICQDALEGVAAKKLDLEMLVERHALPPGDPAQAAEAPLAGGP